MASETVCPTAVPGGIESTYDSMTDRPTDRPTADRPPTEDGPPVRPDPYYSYRVTLPHLHQDTILKLVRQYSDCWCGALHHGDSEDSSEHFHFIFLDFVGQKDVDKFKKAMAKLFASSGNAFHAGKYMDNDPVKALGYMKHDDRATFVHSSCSWWPALIREATPFVKGRDWKPIREKLTDPVLTLSNLLKQAMKYRKEHNLEITNLGNVVCRMVHSGWIPNRDLVTNGIPVEYYQMFLQRIDGKARSYDWMRPHVPTERKKEYGTQLYYGDPMTYAPVTSTFVIPDPPQGPPNHSVQSDHVRDLDGNLPLSRVYKP